MGKLKDKLAPVLKHWFWITTGFVLVGSLAIWWLASGTLISEYQTASSKIESNASLVSGVSGKINEHANPKTHAEMEKLIEARKQAVLEAWTSVYKRQQDILVWPVAELQEDLVSEFRNLTPIELMVEFPTPDEEEKDTSILNRYSYYIKDALPPIAEIAKTKWTAQFDRAGGSMMGGMYEQDTSMSGFPGAGVPLEEGPLVVWNTGSQESLLTDLFPWRGGQPKTLDVLYSQENLWILRQLMEIIASVNGDVGQRFQAKIHEINRLSIGRSVSKVAGKISKPSREGAGMMGGMDGMDMSSGMDMDMMSGGMDDSMMMDSMGGAALVTVDPGDNRYVDLSGKPLTAAELRSALSSNAPDDAFKAVAKRIPVMMSLKMDQRAIPELVAKCGSARLMVEVGQVRILPAGTSASSGMDDGYGGGGMTGMDMGGGMDSSGMGSDMMGGGMMGGGMIASPAGPKVPFPLDLDVEIYGIIYIYNPPLEEKLGIKDVTQDTVVEGTAMIDGSKVATEPAAIPATESLPAPTDPAAVETPPTEEPLPAPGGAVPPTDGAYWIPKKLPFQQLTLYV